jgi:3-phenylpropionate/trans-cinnamate dioxygenase ferredoxin subunit
VAAHPVATLAELAPGSRKIVEVEGRSIGVFNIAGSLYALRNACPHQGAPLCLGRLTGLMAPSPPGEYRLEREGEILRCPWHGWEFDVKTGQSVFNPHRTRVRRYEVTVQRPEVEDPSIEMYPLSVEDGIVLVHL